MIQSPSKFASSFLTLEKSLWVTSKNEMYSADSGLSISPSLKEIFRTSY